MEGCQRQIPEDYPGARGGQAVITFTESVVEDAALAWLESLDYTVLHGPEIATGMPAAERKDPNYRDVVLEQRLREGLVRLNPNLPHEAIEDAFRVLRRS